jgi:uncharacterized RDD family membrane protein YckC
VSSSDLTPGDPLGGGYGSGPVPPGALVRPEAPAPGPPPGPFVLAEYSQRAIAAIIDFAIKAVFALVILAGFGTVLGIGFLADDHGSGIIAFLAALLLVGVAFATASLLYEPVYMAATNGQTLGKQLTKCRVVRTGGEPMSFGWAMLREVAIKWLAIGTIGNTITFGLPLATLADNLWPLWDSEHRALHDYAASTRVVKA